MRRSLRILHGSLQLNLCESSTTVLPCHSVSVVDVVIVAKVVVAAAVAAALVGVSIAQVRMHRFRGPAQWRACSECTGWQGIRSDVPLDSASLYG